MTSPLSTGTVSVTNASTAVTGSGTNWLTAGVKAGDIIFIRATAGTKVCVVAADATSNTSLTLAANYEGATESGRSYHLVRFFGADNAADTYRLLNEVIDTLDYSSVAQDILPDADGTRDLGSAANKWAEGHFNALYPTTVELGHASDTTLARVSAGVISVEGQTVGMLSQSQEWTGENTFSTTSGNTNLEIENPASLGAGTELRLTQNFNGGVAGIWNARKARNSAGALANVNVNDDVLKHEARAFRGGTYKTAARFVASVGSTDITGGGDTPSCDWKLLSRGASDSGNFDTTLETMRVTHLGAVHFPQVGTTGSAANAFIDSGSSPANQLLRSTSSARYKTDIEPLESARADAVLGLQPIWYRSKAQRDKLPDGTVMSFYGLTAEAVAEIDPRLVSWTWHPDDIEEIVTLEDAPPEREDTGKKDKRGRPIYREVGVKEKRVKYRPKANARRVPDGVAYDRLAVLLLDVVKRQETRIAALEAALEKKSR